MVHHLQDEKTNRLNIDVIDLSNLIFICNETGFLEFDEQHRVAPNYFYLIRMQFLPLPKILLCFERTSCMWKTSTRRKCSTSSNWSLHRDLSLHLLTEEIHKTIFICMDISTCKEVAQERQFGILNPQRYEIQLISENVQIRLQDF